MMDPTIVPDLNTIPLMSEDSNGPLFDPPSTGIEATDLSSLLSQFEEASQSFDGIGALPELDAESPKQTPNVKSKSAPSKIKDDNYPAITPPVIPPPEVLARIRAKRKRKLAIMLPTLLPAKKRCAPSPSGKGSSTNTNSSSEVNNNVPGRSMLEAALCQAMVEVKVDNGYFEYIPDHDYCVNSPKLSPKPDKFQQRFENGASFEDGPLMEDQFVNEIVIGVDDTSIVDSDIQVQTSLLADLEEGEVPESPPSNKSRRSPLASTMQSLRKHGNKSKRNFRSRGKSPMQVDSKFFNKIPAYFTTLSTDMKPPKDIKSCVDYNGIKREDFFERDLSASKKDPSLYDKLPAYYSCFTNSTQYDNHSNQQNKYDYDSLDEYPCSKKPKRYRSRSRSRSYSRSRSRSYSRSRSRRRSCCRRRSYSSASGSSSSSSSSRSSSSSCSRSRSRSRSRSYSYSRSRRSYSKSRRSHSRSHSRSRSRYRSRSRSWSLRRDCRYSRSRSLSPSRSLSRCDSIDRQCRSRRSMRERDKEMQIEERRIVYVGKIPDAYTRNELRRRFGRFGNIEEISVHFREAGDNYGFVTFSYTCDAYSAIEKGNDIAGEKRFDLCFGGRRQFCSDEYADLDHETEVKEEFAPLSVSAPLDFDQLLKQAKKQIKKR